MANLQGVTNALSSPAATPDGQPTPNTYRAGKFNELYIGSMFPTKHLAALAGNYYTVAGVAAAGIAVVTSLTALTEASPAMIVENTAPLGGPNVMLDFVRLQATAIAAAATDLEFAWKIDNVRNKWGSAGTAFTPANANAGMVSGSVATVHFGALVVATAQQSSSFAKTLASGWLTPVGTAPVCVIGDTYDFRFGALEAPLPTVISNIASNGAHTFATGLCVPVGPIILTPGTTATLFLWGGATGSAASYAPIAGWYEY